MNLSASFTNAPSASTGSIDAAAAVATFLNGNGKGFTDLMYIDPTEPGSSDNPPFPQGNTGAWWKDAVEAARVRGATLSPYIYGQKTNVGWPTSPGAFDTAAKRWRGSKEVYCDFMAGCEGGGPAERWCDALLVNGLTVAAEANSKQDWLIKKMMSHPGKVTHAARFWLWDLPIPGAKMATPIDKRWKLDELIKMGSMPVVIINQQDSGPGKSDEDQLGFIPNLTADQWAKKVKEMVDLYHGAYGDKVKIVVRPKPGITAAGLA